MFVHRNIAKRLVASYMLPSFQIILRGSTIDIISVFSVIGLSVCPSVRFSSYKVATKNSWNVYQNAFPSALQHGSSEETKNNNNGLNPSAPGQHYQTGDITTKSNPVTAAVTGQQPSLSHPSSSAVTSHTLVTLTAEQVAI